MCGEYCDPGICKSAGNRSCGSMGDLWEDRCSILDGGKRFFYFNYHFCRSELWSGKNKTHEEKRTGLSGNVICGSDCAQRTAGCICGTFIPAFYNRSWSGGNWSLYDEIPDAVLFFFMWQSEYFPELSRGAGKVLVPVILTCGGVCILRITWMFAVLPVFPGIETIMLSYPVSWGITAVLFVIYYIRRFPKAEKSVMASEN